MEQQDQDQPIEVDYETDDDTIMNDVDSITSSVTIVTDVSVYEDDEMTGLLYPQQQTLTIHLVQEGDGSWIRMVTIT